MDGDEFIQPTGENKRVQYIVAYVFLAIGSLFVLVAIIATIVLIIMGKCSCCKRKRRRKEEEKKKLKSLPASSYAFSNGIISTSEKKDLERDQIHINTIYKPQPYSRSHPPSYDGVATRGRPNLPGMSSSKTMPRSRHPDTHVRGHPEAHVRGHSGMVDSSQVVMQVVPSYPTLHDGRGREYIVVDPTHSHTLPVRSNRTQYSYGTRGQHQYTHHMTRDHMTHRDAHQNVFQDDDASLGSAGGLKHDFVDGGTHAAYIATAVSPRESNTDYPTTMAIIDDPHREHREFQEVATYMRWSPSMARKVNASQSGANEGHVARAVSPQPKLNGHVLPDIRV